MVPGPFAQLVIAQLAPNIIIKGPEVLGSEIRSGFKALLHKMLMEVLEWN